MDADERDGLTARWADRGRDGSCNFCLRPHRKVYVVKGRSSLRTLEVRLCQRCRDELMKQSWSRTGGE